MFDIHACTCNQGSGLHNIRRALRASARVRESTPSSLGLRSKRPNLGCHCGDQVADRHLTSPSLAFAMKDIAGWQLQLSKPGTGSAEVWPELSHQGKNYVVGKPKVGFEVTVTPPPGALQPGHHARVRSTALPKLTEEMRSTIEAGADLFKV